MGTIIQRTAHCGARIVRRAVWPLLVLVFAAAVVAGLWAILNWYIQPSAAGTPRDVVAARNGVVDLLIKIVGGGILALGAYFTARTYGLNRSGQITERFGRAIDQLGATDSQGNRRLEVRLGAIYALERIARDSADDHWMIMEVLTAYVRSNAPFPSKEPRQGRLDEEVLQDFARTMEGPVDIQVALTAIARRTRWFGNGESRSLDLNSTDLQGAKLQNAHLEHALLWGACFGVIREEWDPLPGTDLENAQLQGSDLTGALLQGCNLRGADLRGAVLFGTYLQGTDLEEAHLEGIDLSNAYGLTWDQLGQACGDASTKIPDDLGPPPSGWGWRSKK